MLSLTFLALIPRLALGFLVIDMVWPSPSRGRVLKLFMAGPVGFGLSSLLSFLWIWGGLQLRFYAIAETAAVLALFAIAMPSPFRSSRALAHTWEPRRPMLRLGWPIALCTAAVIALAQFWAASLQRPHGGWDAWVHWNVVSRFVYRGGQQWHATFLRVYDQPDYPLLLAMTNATTWELVQRESTRAPMVLAFLYTACLVGVLFGLVRELRGSTQASLAAIVILSQPLLTWTGVSQYADIPEAVYFLSSAGMIVLYLRLGERPLAVLAGLSAGLGAWAKNEGLVFILASLIVWTHISFRRRTPAVKDFLLGAALPLAVLALFKAFLAPAGDLTRDPPAMLASLTDPTRYLSVLHASGRAFVATGLGGLVLALAVYAILVGPGRQTPHGLLYLAFIFAVQLLAYLLVYVGTPYAYGTDAMIPTSIERLWLHVLPLLLVAVFLWLKSPDDLKALGRQLP